MLSVRVQGEARAVSVVLLDLDNTLVDRDGAVRAWLRARGHHDALALVGDTHLSLWTLAAHLSSSVSHDPGALAARVREIRQQLPPLLAIATEARAMIERLRAAGVRVGLVTNGGGDAQRAKLAAAALEPALFDTICISVERKLAKPDPAIFELALAELGGRAEQAVMVGDSPEHDVVGARGAGIVSCWISHGRGYPPGLVAPDHVAVDLAAVAEWLL